MLDTLDRIVADKSGHELRRFMLRFVLSVTCLFVAYHIAYYAAWVTTNPFPELDGRPFAVVDGAYRLYWWPFWAMVITTFVLGFVLRVPISSGWHMPLVPLIIFAYLSEQWGVQKTTDVLVEGEKNSAAHSYHSCTRLRTTRYWRRRMDDPEWKIMYRPDFIYVYTTSVDLCDGVKNAMGGQRPGTNNLFHLSSWKKAQRYRTSIDPNDQYRRGSF